MKRKMSMLLALLCVIFCLCPGTSAATYDLGGTDMRISVDDTAWYVFTRDNIRNNAELEELGISYDYIHDVLYDNEAYMDAVLYYEDGGYVELFVRKRTLDSGVANLSNYSDDEVLKLAKELAGKQNTDEYEVYDSGYKFAKLEYVDSTYGYNICEFVTIVNRDNYTLTFQSTFEFTAREYREIERIVDSIRFDVDTSLKEEATTSFFDGIIGRTVVGAAIGGAVGGVVAMISKKKKKSSDGDPVAEG